MQRPEIQIELHQKQFDAFHSDKRFIACIAGVQGGKTFLGALKTAHSIEQYPNDDQAIIAPTYKILQQSTLPKFFEIAPYLRKYWKQQQSLIEIPRGKDASGNLKFQNIYIRSTDNPLALEGMTLKFAWMDEAGQMKPDAWLFMQARVAIKRGQIFITTTPYNMGWLYLEFYKPCRERKPGYEDFQVYTWASIDNPFFPKDEFERVKKTLDPKTFARRYLGEFTKMEGLVYELQDFQIIEPRPIEGVYTVAGVDFGWNNPAAIGVIREDRDSRFYLVDEYYQKEKTTAEIIEKAKQLREKWGINKFYCDSAEPDRIEEFNRQGLYAETAIKDITPGISRVAQLIRENRFFVFSTCINALQEFETYHYPEKDGDKDNKKDDAPTKKDDHLMDAIRYALYTGYEHSVVAPIYIPKPFKG